MQTDHFEPQFVEEIPAELQAGVLYISIKYAAAQHLCPCGCGSEVVTPLHPTRWRLSYDGETVSLDPSVGSGSLPCRSHYFIRDGRVQRVRWSEEEAELARQRDRIDTEAFFAVGRASTEQFDSRPDDVHRSEGLGRRFWRWLRRARTLRA